MIRILRGLAVAVVILDGAAWVAARDGTVRVQGTSIQTICPPLKAVARPAVRRWAMTTPALDAAAAEVEFDECSKEENDFAPACDPFRECDIDSYTCQLNPRTGYYKYRHMGFCPTCQGGIVESSDPVNGGSDLWNKTSAVSPRWAGLTVHATATSPLELASVSTAGFAGAGSSIAPALSQTGRYVAFESAAVNLVTADTNGQRDVFVRDRQLGQTTRVSVSSTGAEGNGPSISPVMTPDGRYVAFLSQASNLVAGDTNGLGDVFLHDRQTGVTERVNLQPSGNQAIVAAWPDDVSAAFGYPQFSAKSEELAISDDARFIVFTNARFGSIGADRLLAGASILLRDREAGTTTTIATVQPFSPSPIVTSSVGNPSILTTSIPHGMSTGDHVEITGHTGATRPCDNPPCSINTVARYSGFFVSDVDLLPQRVTVLSPTTFSIAVNVTSGGTGGSATRVQDVRTTARPRVSLSADGRFVAFDWLYQLTVDDNYNAGSPRGSRSYASADQRDVYVYDRQTAAFELISRTTTGTSGNGYSGWPSISGDGRYVAFASEASDLVAGDTDGQRNIFVRDRQTGTTQRVPLARGVAPVISRDGRKVAFASVFPGGDAFVYVYDRQTNTFDFVNNFGPNVALANFGLDGPSFGAALNSDGSIVAFGSAATTIVAGDTNGVDDIFIGTFGAPEITSQPADVGNVNVGGSAAVFTVAAAGFPAPRYKWQVSSNGGGSWSDASVALPDRIPSGDTNPTLFVFATASMDGYLFRAIASSIAGSVTSAAATLSLCQYAITPTAATAPAAGGGGSVAVATGASCTWSATSQASFITFSAATNRLGPGNFGYTVAAHNGATRTGTITVAGQTLTVTQSGAPAPATMMALDRTALVFSAVTSGAAFTSQTSAQTVRLTQSGAGAVTWTAASTTPWLVVSPTSGSGSTTLTISTQFASGLTAMQTGSVTLTLTGASNTAGPIAVTLTTTSAATAPTGSFDTPIDGTTGVTGSIAVTGWAMDDIEVTRVRILRDPVAGEPAGTLVFIGNAVLVDGARPDVQALFPTSPRNTRAGWGYLMLTNFLPNLGNGTFRLTAIADDADGHSTTLGTKTITCTNSTATTPTGAIDTPAQGSTVSGNVTNFGWVLSPSPYRADPPGGGTVRVVIDGAFLSAVPSGWTSRSDLTALFPAPQFPGIVNALGVAAFDSTALANGVHTLSWVVTDNVGSASGIGSRYFTVSNGSLLLDPAQPGVTASDGATAVQATATLAMPRAAALRIADSAALLAWEVDAAPAAFASIKGRRGFSLDTPLQAYTVLEGRATMQSEELDRIELHLEGIEGSAPGVESTVTGYLRVPGGIAPLPVGSALNATTGMFTWAPGVGFVGTYDLLFVRWAGGRALARQDVRIVLNPKGGNRVGPQTVIDSPSPAEGTAVVGPSFVLAGWAADLDATVNRGVDAVHVWAYPVTPSTGSGQAADPIWIGAATYGGARPDVAAVYGDRFLTTGYAITAQGLAPGTYDLAVFAYSTVTGGFVPAKTVRVTVR